MSGITLLAVNVGRPEATTAKSGLTGINKRAVAGQVAVSVGGLAGDTICDLANHGGVDQAVYVFTEPDYRWWSAELGQSLRPGTFGENLTVSGLESAALAAGDRLTIGSVVLEVTSPRIPCKTLAVRMRDRTFAKRFMAACRPGFYCRVIVPGTVQEGQAVSVRHFAGPQVTIREMMQGYPFARPEAGFVARALAAPIHHKLRAQLLSWNDRRASHP